MTKEEIISALTEQGIEHDPAAKKAELEALLPEGSETETAGGKIAARAFSIDGTHYAKGEKVSGLTPEQTKRLGAFIE